MKKENKTLSEKIVHGEFVENEWLYKKDVKEHTQNAQRRLKEDIEFRKQFGQISIAEIEIINESIKEIFLEEFGEKIIK